MLKNVHPKRLKSLPMRRSLVGLLDGHKGVPVVDVKFSGDSSLAVTLGRDGRALVWDIMGKDR